MIKRIDGSIQDGTSEPEVVQKIPYLKLKLTDLGDTCARFT